MADEPKPKRRKGAPHRSFRDLRRSRHAEFRYGELLILLFATFFFLGSAPSNSDWVPFVSVCIESVTLLVALAASGVTKRGVLRLAYVVIVVGLVSSMTAWITHDPHATKAASLLTTLLVLVAPLAVIRGVVSRRVIDARTVLAALCLYVMLGLFFTQVFGAIGTISNQPFFVQTAHAGPSDYVYFSFVTITTVGFGDLTAAHSLGRTTAAFEAMIGQFYLVTVVALLVATMKPMARLRSAPSAASSDDDEQPG